MGSLQLNIVTPERSVYTAEVDAITAMTDLGEITVLPGHIPLVATLRAGEAKVRINGTDTYLAMSTGFLEVRPGNEVAILADSAERVEELEIAAIEAARDRAREALTHASLAGAEHYAMAVAILERELARHKVATRRRRM